MHPKSSVNPKHMQLKGSYSKVHQNQDTQSIKDTTRRGAEDDSRGSKCPRESTVNLELYTHCKYLSKTKGK